MISPKIFDGREFLPVSMAAKELQTSTATIRRYCDEGHLAYAVNPRNKYLYVEKDSLLGFRHTLVEVHEPRPG